jgi:superfamily II helicase
MIVFHFVSLFLFVSQVLQIRSMVKSKSVKKAPIAPAKKAALTAKNFGKVVKKAETPHSVADEVAELLQSTRRLLDKKWISKSEHDKRRQQILNPHVDEGKLCVICLDEEREIVMVPCGHYCCCESCAWDVTRCPVCRKTMDIRQKVYH